MICDVCKKKKATVHLTEIIDEQLAEMHLCEECARDKSIQMEQQFGLSDLLAGLAEFNKQQQVEQPQKEDLICANCGMTYEDFKKIGRLGCSECYAAFQEQLEPLLKKIHGSVQHTGKRPNRFVEPQSPQKPPEDETAELRRRLQQAIEQEDFETAARLRDEIKLKEQKNSAVTSQNEGESKATPAKNQTDVSDNNYETGREKPSPQDENNDKENES